MPSNNVLIIIFPFYNPLNALHNVVIAASVELRLAIISCSGESLSRGFFRYVSSSSFLLYLSPELDGPSGDFFNHIAVVIAW